jgi:5'-nucleotidase/UDP-sugar diphosphatase
MQMKIKLSISAILAFIMSLALTAQPGKKLVILHTNDMHSRITGFAPESAYTPLSVNDDNTVGGFARIASIIKNEKDKNNCATLVVDAGDFLMGTLFQGLEVKTGFELSLMKRMGYDVVCIGNHEFDYGPEKLARIISSSEANGEIPALLLSNAVISSKDTADDSLGNLFSSGIIGRKFIIEKEGLKIGFFSLLGKEAVHDAPFAAPVTFSKQAATARKMVKELKADKCDIIICLSHSGVSLDKHGQWGGEDTELAKKVKGIDVIISGHSHTRLDKPLIVNNVPIVQTGSYTEFVGRLALTFQNGKVSVDSYTLLPVDDRIMGDKVTDKLIEAQKKLVDKDILQPIGLSYNGKVAETDFLLQCDEQGDFRNSNLGPLVADAIQSYVNTHVKSGTDISMVATGVIRDNIVPGIQTAPDIFRIMSMGTGRDNVPGYPLSRIYVTGKELKSVLEILQAASKTPANYCFYSGLRAEMDPHRGMLRKITRIDLVRQDGSLVNVDFSKKNKTLYSVTANSYMLQFVGIIKKMSFGIINVVPKDASGTRITDMKNAEIDIDENKEGLQEGKEWLAIMEYLRSMKDTNGNGIPDIDPKYKNSIKAVVPVSSR